MKVLGTEDEVVAAVAKVDEASKKHGAEPPSELGDLFATALVSLMRIANSLDALEKNTRPR